MKMHRGKEYYMVNNWSKTGELQVYKATWTNHSIDYQRESRGNMFATEKEANQHINQLQLSGHAQ